MSIAGVQVDAFRKAPSCRWIKCGSSRSAGTPIGSIPPGRRDRPPRHRRSWRASGWRASSGGLRNRGHVGVHTESLDQSIEDVDAELERPVNFGHYASIPKVPTAQLEQQRRKLEMQREQSSEQQTNSWSEPRLSTNGEWIGGTQKLLQLWRATADLSKSPIPPGMSPEVQRAAAKYRDMIRLNQLDIERSLRSRGVNLVPSPQPIPMPMTQPLFKTVPGSPIHVVPPVCGPAFCR